MRVVVFIVVLFCSLGCVLASVRGSTLAVSNGYTARNNVPVNTENNNANSNVITATTETQLDDSPTALRFSGKLLGCYVDQPTRDLPYRVDITGGTTVAICLNACGSRGYTYGGLQAGGECFCGNTYGGYGGASNCDRSCNGNSADNCGGTWANAIYRVERHVSYLGCFEDKVDRDFSVQTSDVATIQQCNLQCRAAGYAYYGLQYSRQCFCSNNYGKYRMLDESRCDMSCSGSTGGAKCGGDLSNSVYRVQVWNPDVGYLGCFRDSLNRDLPTKVIESDSLSIGQCVATCASSGYRYAGVQYANQCWCGNSYGGQGRLEDKTCNMQCGTKQTYSNPYSGKVEVLNQLCGGVWANHVYDTLGWDAVIYQNLKQTGALVY